MPNLTGRKGNANEARQFPEMGRPKDDAVQNVKGKYLSAGSEQIVVTW